MDHLTPRYWLMDENFQNLLIPRDQYITCKKHNFLQFNDFMQFRNQSYLNQDIFNPSRILQLIYTLNISFYFYVDVPTNNHYFKTEKGLRDRVHSTSIHKHQEVNDQPQITLQVRIEWGCTYWSLNLVSSFNPCHEV